MQEKIIFIGLLTLNSFCTPRTKAQVDSDCKKFNSQGVDSLMKYKVQPKKRKSTLESSLQLFNQAIKCDSNLNVARFNKISVLGELGQYRDAIETIDDLVGRSKDSTELLRKASIYDMLNERELSIKTYKMAYKYFVRMLNEHPQNASLIYSKILAQSKVQGKDNIGSEIDYYLKKYPNDSNLKSLLETIPR